MSRFRFTGDMGNGGGIMRFLLSMAAIVGAFHAPACMAQTRGASPTGCPPEMVLIPAGPFRMGEGRGTTVDLPAFCIDRTPVTNARYKDFVSAARYHPPQSIFEKSNEIPDADLWRGDEYPKNIAEQPVINVSWISAQSYCHWNGKRLPTEAEWEKAARGTEGRAFPWGNSPPDASRAWFNKRWQKTETLRAVGSFPAAASPYGVQDMAGNVWHWTSTLYADYPYNLADGREDPGASGERVLRGGAWNSPAERLQSAARWSYPPHGAEPIIGLRCARALADERKSYVSRDKRFSAKLPSYWTTVERYQLDANTRQKRLVDIIGFVHGNLDVTISVRSVPSEGDSTHEFLPDYLESGSGKPYNQTLFRYGRQVYYSVDRPTGQVLGKTELDVDGEKAFAIIFMPALARPLDIPPFTDRVKVKEVLVRRGSEIFFFTLNGVEDEFVRDERLLDEFVRSVRWLR